jgi:hypothetical protein
MKALSSNIQAPEKLQPPSSNHGACDFLDVEVWSFSGCWSLVLGAFPLRLA